MCVCVRAFATVYTFLPDTIDLLNKWKCIRKCEVGIGLFISVIKLTLIAHVSYNALFDWT